MLSMKSACKERRVKYEIITKHDLPKLRHAEKVNGTGSSSSEF